MDLGRRSSTLRRAGRLVDVLFPASQRRPQVGHPRRLARRKIARLAHIVGQVEELGRPVALLHEFPRSAPHRPAGSGPPEERPVRERPPRVEVATTLVAVAGT